MNPQTLNQLIVDRAANQMPADIAELLDAYLLHDGEAARRLGEYRGTLALAAQAIRRDAGSVALPQFPASRIAATKHRRRAARWLRPAAVAAGLALAFLTGMKWNRTAQSMDAPMFVATAVPNNAFWAAESVRAAALDRPSVESNKVRWSSPLRWPQTGGQS